MQHSGCWVRHRYHLCVLLHAALESAPDAPATQPSYSIPLFPEQLWEEMRREGCRPNVVTYNALIGACAQGEPDVACMTLAFSRIRHLASSTLKHLHLHLQHEGDEQRLVLLQPCSLGWAFVSRLGPSSSLTCLIDPPHLPPPIPSAAAGMWAKAAEAFEAMLASGCRPDAVTHSVLISAYERGGQWRRCLQAFEMMQQQGFRPDACVYNVVRFRGLECRFCHPKSCHGGC